jgi:hypothetical protein
MAAFGVSPRRLTGCVAGMFTVPLPHDPFRYPGDFVTVTKSSIHTTCHPRGERFRPQG